MAHENSIDFGALNNNERAPLVTWEYASEQKAGADAGVALKKELEGRGWSESEIDNFENAVTEAVENAVVHGNFGLKHISGEDHEAYLKRIAMAEQDPVNHGKKVEVIARFENDLVEVTIQSEGQDFKPEEIPDPTSDEGLEKASGRGMFLSAALSDNAYFDPAKGVTILTKFKKAAQ